MQTQGSNSKFFFFSVLDPAQFTELHTCCTAALAGNQTENTGKSFTWMQEDCQMSAVPKQHVWLKRTQFREKIGIICRPQYYKPPDYTEYSLHLLLPGGRPGTTSTSRLSLVDLEGLPLCFRPVNDQLHLHKSPESLSRVDKSCSS